MKLKQIPLTVPSDVPLPQYAIGQAVWNYSDEPENTKCKIIGLFYVEDEDCDYDAGWWYSILIQYPFYIRGRDIAHIHEECIKAKGLG